MVVKATVAVLVPVLYVIVTSTELKSAPSEALTVRTTSAVLASPTGHSVVVSIAPI